MILVDTSAWVEYDRATGSPVDRRVTDLINAAAPIAVTESVIMEVTAGARDDRRESQLRGLLLSFELIPFDGVADFDGAVRVYRRCRSAGVTPPGLLNCLIAAVALRQGATLLACDLDLARIAPVVALDLDEATPRP